MDTKAGPVPLTDDQVRSLARGEVSPPEITRLIEAHAMTRKIVARPEPSSAYDEKQRPRAASADEASGLRDAHRSAATKEARQGKRPDLKPPQ
jgi:hypothetical protein